ncbi:hypothetical protein IE979_26365 [Klebsiella pneumoniae]|uniref:Uncharacterized protein n=1 Tax=Klebsiella pneumoniae TaxID=573 RepID=A0A927DR04_KLEPN|nr:hypothetical protein [Klebsiella pneumoniae]
MGDLWPAGRETPRRPRATALKSLGYGRWQCLRWLVLPALLPALGMVLLATTALEPVGGRRRHRCWGPAIRPPSPCWRGNG